MTDKWECKIQCLQQPQENPIKLNPNKVKAPKDSFIRISSKNDAEKCVYARVTAFDDTLKYHGLSIELNLSKVFEFQSNEEVVVEVVDMEECEIQMLEVTCADQYVSRGDMWTFKQALIGSCTYRKKHIDISGITVQVRALYKDEKEIKSGCISVDTKVTYRSLSSYTQLFIQIGKEMWENDYEGVENWENFEKVVYQFVKKLFEKWEAQKANHDLQIIFFTRLFFEEDKYPDYKETMIQFDGEGRPYLDIYDVVCDGGNITDVKPIMRLMKRRFNKLGLIIAKLEETHSVEVSASSKGNFLECINLALDQYMNHFQDRVHYRCGQQIVVVTAGSGLFYVNRELAAFTKHRVLDLGVGADVVCLGKKPLHATPLFVFQPQQNKKSEGNQFDKFQVPHWMNMHFYALHEQAGKFVPIMGMHGYEGESGERIVPYKGRASHFLTNLALNSNRQLDKLCDEYDANLMCPAPVSHHHSAGAGNYEVHSDETPNSLSSDAEINSRANTPSSMGTSSIDRRKAASHSVLPEVNPFKPSNLPRPITSNRRRWAHVFPCAKSPQKTWHGLSRSLLIEQDPSAEHVDWQSLIAPACFPATTDYYPDAYYMDKENKEWHYSFTFTGDVNINSAQFLSELVIQRLSRGFQLVLKKNQGKSLAFSLGHDYHRIRHDNAGKIEVSITKPRKQSQYPACPSQKIYKYCLIPYLGKLENIDNSLINCETERKMRELMVAHAHQWNKFDHYVQRLIDPDISDDPRPKEDSNAQLGPWRSRYVILPRPDYYFPDHDVNSELLDDKAVVNNFYSIIFAMNNIRHQDFNAGETKRFSLSVGSHSGMHSAPNSPSALDPDQTTPRPRTNTLVDSRAFPFSTGSSEEDNNPRSEEKESRSSSSYFKLGLFQKSKASDIDAKEFRESIMNPVNEMRFIAKPTKSCITGHTTQPILPPHSFLASYLVEWVMKTRTFQRKEAVEFCQELLRLKIIEETIEHSDDEKGALFVDGFYFYHLKPEKKERFAQPKVLFEVATPEASRRSDQFIPIIPDCDIEIQSPQRLTNRREFFTVDYDSCYDPRHAYGLTVQWDRATAQLIEVCYLSKWRMKTEKAGFQLVQVPLRPFNSPAIDQDPARKNATIAPFRAPIDIPIPRTDFESIENMLYKFGFLHDCPGGHFSDEQATNYGIEHRRRDFVHLSGIALVRVCMESAVLKWASNAFLGSKKWHPKIFLPNNKKEEKFYQMSFEDLLTRFREHLVASNFGDLQESKV